MKVERNLKIVLILLLIILLSIVSFGGIFVQKGNAVKNIIPEYSLGMDLTGSRMISLEVSTATNKIIYDKDGKVVTEEGEGTTTKEEPVNKEEDLNAENYIKSKQIIEKRLKEMRVENYTLRFDEQNGKIYLQLPENSDTDIIAQYTAIKGIFSVTGENDEILLNNSHIKKAQVQYSTTENGTVIYLVMQFNEEGKNILKDITNTYVKTTNEEGEETTKQVTFKLDDTELLSTYFSEEISNGMIQLSIGQASTSNSQISNYLKEASNIAMLLNTGNMPLAYNIETNRYVMSDITLEAFYIPAIVAAIITAVALVFLVIKYKRNGLFCAINFIGYIAALLLLVRVIPNVVITLEGIAGIIVSIILNYMLNVYLLHVLKTNKQTGEIEETSHNFNLAFTKSLLMLIPSVVIAVISCFIGWLPIYSFGMTSLWGIVLVILYNLIFTRTLLK